MPSLHARENQGPPKHVWANIMVEEIVVMIVIEVVVHQLDHQQIGNQSTTFDTRLPRLRQGCSDSKCFELCSVFITSNSSILALEGGITSFPNIFTCKAHFIANHRADPKSGVFIITKCPHSTDRQPGRCSEAQFSKVGSCDSCSKLLSH